MSKIYKTLFYLVANHLPAPFVIGYRLRVLLARRFNPNIHATARIAPNVHLGSSLVIGQRSGFGAGSMVLGGGRLCIGDHVRMGPQCMFITGDHVIPSDGGTFDQSGSVTQDIEVGDDVYLGARAVILGGVRVGVGAAVGAGAVVTKDVADGAVVVGIPAREVSRRTI